MATCCHLRAQSTWIHHRDATHMLASRKDLSLLACSPNNMSDHFRHSSTNVQTAQRQSLGASMQSVGQPNPKEDQL